MAGITSGSPPSGLPPALGQPDGGDDADGDQQSVGPEMQGPDAEPVGRRARQVGNEGGSGPHAPQRRSRRAWASVQGWICGPAVRFRSGPPTTARGPTSRSSPPSPSRSSCACSGPGARRPGSPCRKRRPTAGTVTSRASDRGSATASGCQGPFKPEEGLWCNPAKLLLDPYAKAIDGADPVERGLLRLPFRHRAGQERARQQPLHAPLGGRRHHLRLGSRRLARPAPGTSR